VLSASSRAFPEFSPPSTRLRIVHVSEPGVCCSCGSGCDGGVEDHSGPYPTIVLVKQLDYLVESLRREIYFFSLSLETYSKAFMTGNFEPHDDNNSTEDNEDKENV